MYMKKHFVWVAVIIAILLIAALKFSILKQQMKQATTLKIDGIILNIGVADTDAERTQGLSGRSGLDDNEGLLFIFDKEGHYEFWMKDMNFPIDMAWFDKNKKLIYVANDVATSTYPNSFSSQTPALYVLETSSGFFNKNNIKIGDSIAF